MKRLSVLLAPAADGDEEALQQVCRTVLPARPGSVRTMSRFSVDSLVQTVQSLGASMLVLGASPEFMEPGILRELRRRLRCPVCLVRYWGENR